MYGLGLMIDLSDDIQSQPGPYTFCSIYSKELSNTIVCPFANLTDFTKPA